MTPRSDVSEQRRMQIMEAAMKVFARQGIDGARIDDIVEEAGLSKGAFYWYFESKNELVTAILEGLFESELIDLENTGGQGTSASERMTTFIRRVCTDLQESAEILPIMFEFYALAFRDPAVWKSMEKFFRRYVQALAPVIEQGIESGEFRPLDVQEAAIAVGAVLEGTLLLWAYDPETVKLERHLESGLRLLLKGIMK